MLVSALDGEGLEELEERIERAFARTLRPVELLLPYAEGGRLAELHDVAGDLEREDTAEGVRVRARVPATVAERYARFAVADGAADGSGPRAPSRRLGRGERVRGHRRPVRLGVQRLHPARGAAGAGPRRRRRPRPA